MYLIARALAAIGLVVLATSCAAPRSSAKIWIGGDVFLGRGVDLMALAGLGDGIVNLEGAVDPAASPAAGQVGARVVLVHAASVLPALRTAGVRAAAIANNHAADAPGGVEATAAALSAAGVDPVGGARTAAWTAGPRDVVVHAARVGDAVGPLPADLDIVLVHDDAPPGWRPTAAMAATVDAAIAAGAEVVVGGGRHAFGTVERRGGAWVAWGLGDLAFDCACTDATEGLVLVLDPHAPDLAPDLVVVGVGKVDAPVRFVDPRDAVDRIEEMGGAAFERTTRGMKLR